MANFVRLDENNRVAEVIVIDNGTINNSEFPDSESYGKDFIKNQLNLDGIWIQTSYSGLFRKKFACVDDYYDQINDVFISPKPYDSWVLDSNFEWIAPIEKPSDGNLYRWIESSQSWEQFYLPE